MQLSDVSYWPTVRLLTIRQSIYRVLFTQPCRLALITEHWIQSQTQPRLNEFVWSSIDIDWMPLVGGIQRWCASDVCLSDVLRLSDARQTKIGTEEAHVTRDSDTTFNFKRSKVNLQGAGAYCGGLQHSLFHAFFWQEFPTGQQIHKTTGARRFYHAQ